jgi:glucose-6-phosphate 1-dehydrogenase
MSDLHSDALAFFGATGDLAYKKIFPALQAMVKRGHLNVPVIGDCTEVLARFREPPTLFNAGTPSPNHLRFRISPEMTIAVGTNVMAPVTAAAGDAVETVEIIASQHPSPEEMEAYERVLGDAMVGDATHFARQDYVEEAWRIVDPVLKAASPVDEYDKGTWGPSQVDQRLSPAGGWHNPTTTDQEDFRVAGHGA